MGPFDICKNATGQYVDGKIKQLNQTGKNTLFLREKQEQPLSVAQKSSQLDSRKDYCDQLRSHREPIVIPVSALFKPF